MNYETYEDLNKAKKKILYLMKLKYSSVDANELNDDTSKNNTVESVFTKILRDMESINTKLYQMATFVGVNESSSRVKSKVFRSTNAYYNFNQFSIEIGNSLYDINKDLETIINDIGYVEPEDIQIFFDLKTKMNENHIYLSSLIYSARGNFRIILNITNNVDEKENMVNLLTKIETEIIKLSEYEQTIRETYNYKSANKPINNPKFVNDKIEEKDNKFFADDE